MSPWRRKNPKKSRKSRAGIFCFRMSKKRDRIKKRRKRIPLLKLKNCGFNIDFLLFCSSSTLF
jgi:hypothetical protein